MYAAYVAFGSLQHEDSLFHNVGVPVVLFPDPIGHSGHKSSAAVKIGSGSETRCPEQKAMNSLLVYPALCYVVLLLVHSARGGDRVSCPPLLPQP